jgi:hypothetical protein
MPYAVPPPLPPPTNPFTHDHHPQAQRTKFAKPLVEKAARAILLSGTPALSNPSELLSQLQALLPKARLTKTAFEERYMEVRQFNGFRKAVRVGAGASGGGDGESGRQGQEF